MESVHGERTGHLRDVQVPPEIIDKHIAVERRIVLHRAAVDRQRGAQDSRWVVSIVSIGIDHPLHGEGIADEAGARWSKYPRRVEAGCRGETVVAIDDAGHGHGDDIGVGWCHQQQEECNQFFHRGPRKSGPAGKVASARRGPLISKSNIGVCVPWHFLDGAAVRRSNQPPGRPVNAAGLSGPSVEGPALTQRVLRALFLRLEDAA